MEKKSMRRETYEGNLAFAIKAVEEYNCDFFMKAMKFIDKLVAKGVSLEHIYTNDWNSNTNPGVYLGDKFFNRFSDWDLSRAVRHYRGISTPLLPSDVEMWEERWHREGQMNKQAISYRELKNVLNYTGTKQQLEYTKKAEELIHIDNEIWDQLGIDGSMPIKTDPAIRSLYVKKIRERITEKVPAPVFLWLEDNNYHTLNEVLVYLNLFTPNIEIELYTFKDIPLEIEQWEERWHKESNINRWIQKRGKFCKNADVKDDIKTLLDDKKYDEAMKLIDQNNLINEYDIKEIVKNVDNRADMFGYIEKYNLNVRELFTDEEINNIIKDIQDASKYIISLIESNKDISEFVSSSTYQTVQKASKMLNFDFDGYINEYLDYAKRYSGYSYHFPPLEHKKWEETEKGKQIKTETHIKTKEDVQKLRQTKITDTDHREFPYTVVPSKTQFSVNEILVGRRNYKMFSFSINSTGSEFVNNPIIDKTTGKKITEFPEEIFKGLSIEHHVHEGNRPVAFVYGAYYPGEELYVAEMQSDQVQTASLYLQSEVNAIEKANARILKIYAPYISDKLLYQLRKKIPQQENVDISDELYRVLSNYIVGKIPSWRDYEDNPKETLSNLPKKMTEEDKVKLIKTRQLIKDIQEGYRKGKFMPQYEQYKSRFENYFSGWNIMAMNAVLNFAREHLIKTVYVSTAEQRMKTWKQYAHGEETMDLYKRVYDNMMVEKYGAVKDGDWWKIELKDIVEKIANQNRLIKQSRYEKLYELHPPEFTGEEVKNKLLEIPEVKQIVDENIPEQEWKDLKIAFWTHMPWYDEQRYVILFPKSYYEAIMGIEAQYSLEGIDIESIMSPYEQELEELIKMHPEQEEELTQKYYETLEQYMPGEGGIKYKPTLSDHEKRMILHELNHYADHIQRQEQFVEETTKYFKDPEEIQIDMEKYFKSRAEQLSFLTEMKYMREKGYDDDDIVHTMLGTYGGDEKYWRDLLGEIGLEKTSELDYQKIIKEYEDSPGFELEYIKIGSAYIHFERVDSTEMDIIVTYTIDTDDLMFEPHIYGDLVRKYNQVEDKDEFMTDVIHTVIDEYGRTSFELSIMTSLDIPPIIDLVIAMDLKDMTEQEIENDVDIHFSELMRAANKFSELLIDKMSDKLGLGYFHTLEKVTGPDMPSPEVEQWEERWHKESQLNKQARIWSVWDTQTDQWMESGKNAPSLADAIEEIWQYLIGGHEFEDEQIEAFENMSLREKKDYIESYEFLIVPVESSTVAGYPPEFSQGDIEKAISEEEGVPTEVEQWEERWHKEGQLKKCAFEIGQRVRLKFDPRDEDYELDGATGTLTHPFPGLAYSGYTPDFGIQFDVSIAGWIGEIANISNEDIGEVIGLESLEKPEISPEVEQWEERWHREAQGTIQLWIDPEGQEYEVTGQGHWGWMFDNQDLLKEKYGIDMEQELIDMKEGKSESGQGEEILLKKGWVRMSGVGNFSVWNVSDSNTLDIIQMYLQKYPSKEYYIDFKEPKDHYIRFSKEEMDKYEMDEIVDMGLKFRATYGSVNIKEMEVREKQKLAQDPNTPLETLNELSQDNSAHVRWAVAKNTNLPEELMFELALDENPTVISGIASNPSIPIDLLYDLVESDVEIVRWSVLLNPKVPVDIIQKCTTDKNKYVSSFANKLLQKTKTAEKKVNPFEYQDTNQEIIIHSDWKGQELRHVLEGTGDIFREITKGEYLDWGYVNEKINRAKGYINRGRFHPDDSYNTALKNNPDHIKNLLDQWQAQPVENELQEIAKELNIVMVKGEFDIAIALIGQLEDIRDNEQTKEFLKQAELKLEDEKIIKDIVLEGGGKEPIAIADYSKYGKGLIVFFHNNYDSQTSLPLDQLSVENVRKRVEQTDALWKESKLEEYKEKRDFDVTSEPEPTGKKAENIWVLQRHHAEKAGLHGDLRLEKDGVLKSFAIRKLDDFIDGKLDRVLVINTEDHPIEYAEFEGSIPKGEYGGGLIEIEDGGEFETISETHRKWTFALDGDKLNGIFTLVQAESDKYGKDKWFLIRDKDKEANLVNRKFYKSTSQLFHNIVKTV